MTPWIEMTTNNGGERGPLPIAGRREDAVDRYAQINWERLAPIEMTF